MINRSKDTDPKGNNSPPFLLSCGRAWIPMVEELSTLDGPAGPVFRQIKSPSTMRIHLHRQLFFFFKSQENVVKKSSHGPFKIKEKERWVHQRFLENKTFSN